MIPLLLCASHIAKLLYVFFGTERAEGFRSYLRGAIDAVLIGKAPFEEQASTVRRRREGPETVGLVEATASAEAVDNST